MDVVVVVGGGIGGLAVASALATAGHQVQVLERSASTQVEGSGLVIAPNGMKALTAVAPSAATAVRAGGHVAGAIDQRTPATGFLDRRGRLLSASDFDGLEEQFGAPLVSILRADLAAALGDAARDAGADVQRGVTVVDVDIDGRVTLDDGTTITADLVVGADGLRSRVRRVVVRDGEPRYVGYGAVRGVAPIPSAHPGGFIAYGRGAIIFCSPVDDERAYWVVSIRAPEGAWSSLDPGTAREQVLGLLDGWADDVLAVVRDADPAELVVTDVHDRDPVETWTARRLVLLGDAAHPMTYTLGQGANMALEDAAVLAAMLTDDTDPDDALAAYVAARAARTARVVKQSRFFGTVGHAANPLLAATRDLLFRGMGLLPGDGRDADLFGWEPPRHVAARGT